MKHTDQLNGKMFDKILCEKKTTKTIILEQNLSKIAE